MRLYFFAWSVFLELLLFFVWLGIGGGGDGEGRKLFMGNIVTKTGFDPMFPRDVRVWGFLLKGDEKIRVEFMVKRYEAPGRIFIFFFK